MFDTLAEELKQYKNETRLELLQRLVNEAKTADDIDPTKILTRPERRYLKKLWKQYKT